jgi:hypothetical protein
MKKILVSLWLWLFLSVCFGVNPAVDSSSYAVDPNEKNLISVSLTPYFVAAQDQLSFDSFNTTRLTIHDEDKNRYVFISRSNEVGLDGADYWIIANNSNSYVETSFIQTKVGVGASIPLIPAWSISLDLEGSIFVYEGDYDQFNISGLEVGLGLSKEISISRSFYMYPTFLIGYSLINGANIDGDLYEFVDNFSGMTSSAGVTFKYNF